MAAIRRARIVLRSTLVMVLLCLPLLVFAQNDVSTALPSIEDIDHRLQVVQTTSVLSDEERGALTLYLERTRAALQRQSEFKEQARAFAEVQLTATEQTLALDAELSAFTPPPLPDTARLSSHALQFLLAERRLTLRDWKNEAASLEAEIRDELSVDPAMLVAETRTRYDAMLADTTGNDLPESLQAVAAEARAAEEAMLRARIDMLDQRLLSRRPRLDIRRRELQLLQSKIAAAEDQIERLSSSEVSQNVEAADRRVTQAESTAVSAESIGAEFLLRAERNVELAKELRQLIETRAAMTERSSAIGRRVDRLKDQLNALTEQLDRPRLPRTPQFGAALLRQKALMTSEPLTAKEEGDFDREMSALRLRQFELFESSQESWLVESDRAQPDDSTQQLMNTISSQGRELLSDLTADYAQYDAQLSLIDNQVQRLAEMGVAYQERVDRHLLWNPSAEVFGITTLTSVLNLITDGADTEAKITPTVPQLFARRPLLSMLAVLVISALLLLRRRHVLALGEMRAWIGRVQSDRLALTIHALWRTLLLALPIPLALATPGLLSLTIADARPQLLPAFLLSALLYFGFEFFRQILRTDGLAELHFRWRADQVDLIRRKLRLFMPLFVLPAIAGILLHYLGTLAANASVGRIAYLMATLAFAGFSFSIIRPSAMAKSSGTRLHRPVFRYGVVLFGVLLPSLLAILALLGYQHAAEILATRLLVSIGVFVGFLLVFDFAIRAVAVSERQLALKRVRARRVAAQKTDGESEAGQVPLETDEIDLQTISDHSRTLITLFVSIIAVISIGSVWADLFLAFEPLQSFALWQVTSEVDGVSTVQNITLWSLLTTVVVLLITYLGVKNIPGTLEVLVLSRMSLAGGMSYAITSVVTYVIVLTGAIVALQLIGAQWSKLQWLIAALGVGLGFGLQEIVANFVSGVLILFERPIRLGDTVTLGDQTGIVTRIRIRATTIMDWDRKEILIPNKAFITDRLINWTLTDPIMRLIIRVGVAYDSDIDLVEKVLLDAARLNSRVLDEPAATVLFDQFGDSSLVFELRVFIKGIQDAVPTRHELHKAITALFRENSIEISFPQRDVHFDSGPLEISILDPKNTA